MAQIHKSSETGSQAYASRDDAVGNARRAVEDAIRSLEEQAYAPHDVFEAAVEAARATGNWARAAAKESPYPAIAAGAALGLLVGVILGGLLPGNPTTPPPPPSRSPEVAPRRESPLEKKRWKWWR